ncbi:MAG: GumC family protein [Kiritimatiellia bacterium]
MKGIIEPPVPPSSAGQTPAQGPAPTGKPFDIVMLKQYLHIVIKRIWLIALCFVVAEAVMVVMLMRQEDTYSSTATLMFSEGLPIPVQLQTRETRTMGDYISTQQRIIETKVIQKRAIARTGYSPADARRLLIRSSVDAVGKTSILAITVKSRDPNFSAAYANALAEEYIDSKAEERIGTSESTVIGLTRQADRLREELRRADEKVLAFKKDNRVIAIRERGNIAAEYLAKLSSRAAAYRTERMLLEAEQPLISDASDEIVLAALSGPQTSITAGGSPAITDLGVGTNIAVTVSHGPAGLIERGVVTQPGWQELRREKARLESELAELRTKFRDAHPTIQQYLTRLNEVDRQIDVELKFALAQYYANLEALAIKEEAVRRVEKEWEEEALRVSRKSHEYENLQRNVERLQSLYDLIFNRLKELDISIGIEPESVRIMERAQAATSPDQPRRLKNIFMAALIGLGAGLALVFGIEYIDDSLRYPEEITRDLKLPFSGVVPSAAWDAEDMRSHLLTNIDQKSGLAESYRNIRSSLLFSGSGVRAMKTLAVTSAVPREGKTTTAVNIALSLSLAGERILLIDGDMRRGEVHKYFGLEAGKGLSDVLQGQAKAEAVIQRTSFSNLDLLATGDFPEQPAELVLRPEFLSLLEYAKRTYDRIIFDCPPVMAVSEAAILTSQVEGVVFVVWAGKTSRKQTQLAVQILKERGANIIGCILNNLEFGRVGYYYYSTYYGYYDYEYLYEHQHQDKS